MRFRPRSMRIKVFLALAVVLMLPYLVVVASYEFESGVGQRMQRRTLEAAAEVAAVIDAQPSPDWPAIGEAAETAALRRDVRIRVVPALGGAGVDADHEAGSGLYVWLGSLFFGTKGTPAAETPQTPTIDANHESGNSLLIWLGSLFFGPDGAPSLTQYDDSLPPVAVRDESLAAVKNGQDVGCRHSPHRTLLVCHAALRAGPSTAPVLVYVQESSRRAIRALYDVRYQVLKLTLFALPLGILVALWLAWRLTGPLQALRRQVMSRVTATTPKGGLDTRRDDEIGDLARSFNALIESLAERSRANERFVADLAHEFKNPVAALSACADSLADSARQDPERLARLAGVMHQSCQRLDRLVSEFLELARAEAGLPREGREPIDVAALCRGLVASVASDERYRDRKLVLEGATTQVEVSAVPRHLESALRNLLDNAASFAGAGGEVRLSLARDGAWVVVRVADNGPGIAAHDLPRVFERFFTTRGEKRGTGLGLALTRAVVEAHGGTIAVSSEAGRGAVFTLRWPAAPGTPG